MVAHVGIAVTDEGIYGVEGSVVDKHVQLKNTFELAREGTIQEDCTRFVKCFSLEDKKISIVYDGVSRAQTMWVPTMSRRELRQVFRNQLEDTLDIDREEEVADFMVLNRGERQIMFIVAIDRDIVYALAEGILRGHGHLRVIDHWLAPVGYVCGKREAMVIGIPLDDEQMELTLWSDVVCFGSVKVDFTEEGIAKGLDVLTVKGTEFELPAIEGLRCYDVSDEKKALLEQLYTKHGYIEDAYEVDSLDWLESKEGVSHWDMALGLMIRGCRRPS